MKDEALTQRIIGCAYKVYNALGSGFLEKVYENSLRIEMEKQGLRVAQQRPISVRYEGEIVGEYYADFVVEDRVIVEAKAVDGMTRAHEIQLVNYLVATGIDVGLLINFGPTIQIKRKHREYKHKPSQPPIRSRHGVSRLNSGPVILRNPVHPEDPVIL